jgi:hypothetical protein
MSDATTIVDAYLAAYGEPEPARQRSLIERSWSPAGTLSDPPMEATGHDQIGDMFAAVQSQFPGHTFRRTTVVDIHHQSGRYGWDLVAADGSVTLSGTDFARFGDDGHLVHVTGFFGPLTSIETSPS